MEPSNTAQQQEPSVDDAVIDVSGSMGELLLAAESLPEQWCRHLVELPDDLLCRIVAACDSSLTLAQMAASCRWLRAIITEDVWRNLVLQKYGGWLVPRANNTGHTWHTLCVRLHTRSHSRFCVVGGVELDVIGEEPHAKSFAAVLMPDDEEWAALPPPSGVREGAAVVRGADGRLIAIGGTSSVWNEEFSAISFRTLDSVEACDVSGACSWSELPRLSTPRCCCGGAVDSRGNLYACGGGESMYRGAPTLETVERYSIDAGSWSQAPSMQHRRCGVGVALRMETDTLFAFGGYAGGRCGESYLDTCECLDVGPGGEGRWRPLPRMSVQRAGTNAAAGPDGRLYVLGGGPDGQREWKTMEALDPRICSWDTSLAPLHCGRHYNAAAFGPDGRLYVSGAFRHLGQLDVVERWDPRVDRWEIIEPVGTAVKFSAGAFVF